MSKYFSIQNILLFFSAVCVLTSVLIIVVLLNAKNKQIKQIGLSLQATVEENKNNKAEIDELRSQLNSSFLRPDAYEFVDPCSDGFCLLKNTENETIGLTRAKGYYRKSDPVLPLGCDPGDTSALCQPTQCDQLVITESPEDANFVPDKNGTKIISIHLEKTENPLDLGYSPLLSSDEIKLIKTSSAEKPVGLQLWQMPTPHTEYLACFSRYQIIGIYK